MYSICQELNEKFRVNTRLPPAASEWIIDVLMIYAPCMIYNLKHRKSNRAWKARKKAPAQSGFSLPQAEEATGQKLPNYNIVFPPNIPPPPLCLSMGVSTSILQLQAQITRLEHQQEADQAGLRQFQKIYRE
jgi:hypothetical protein